MSYLVGVDLGTSGMKTVLLDPETGVVALAEQPYPMHRPSPAWAENDPEDWYRALVTTVGAVLERGRVRPADVVALCIVAQRDPVVLVDAPGEVLTPSINWTDRRDPEETERLYAELDRGRLLDITGVVPIPGLTLPNLVWTRHHLPDVWRRVRYALPPKDYLAFRLTGDVGTDISTPSRSILNDWRADAWSAEICEAADLPIEILPPVRYRPWEPRAELSARAAAELGLDPGTILAVGGGDDQAATLACGVIDVGDVSIGTGSSSCWRVVTGQPLVDPAARGCLARHVVEDRFIYELILVSTGTSFRWFREAFGGSASTPGTTASYEELIAEAASIEPGADGLFFYPYVDGARNPYYNDFARAVFHGIGAGHGRGHLVRSILEGIAFNYPPMLEIIADLGAPIGTLTIVDGEARSGLWNQIKADVLGRELRTIGVVEAAAVGSAILAGLAVGAFASPAEAVARLVAVRDTYPPDPERHRRYEPLRRRWEAVRRSLWPTFRAPEHEAGARGARSELLAGSQATPTLAVAASSGGGGPID